MNVLAHLHLASLANSSIIGNAAADFVKGDPYQQYQPAIADGIMMHRRLDKMVDELAEVKQAKLLFRQETRRVAPIALDIIWDHFLSKHWRHYVNQELADFNLAMKMAIDKNIALFPNEFSQFMGYLWQREWLTHYAQVNFIEKVLNGMANQRPKLALLRMTFQDFTVNYAELETIFSAFYPQLIIKAKAGQI